jgi:hypothetical protein
LKANKVKNPMSALPNILTEWKSSAPSEEQIQEWLAEPENLELSPFPEHYIITRKDTLVHNNEESLNLPYNDNPIWRPWSLYMKRESAKLSNPRACPFLSGSIATSSNCSCNYSADLIKKYCTCVSIITDLSQQRDRCGILTLISDPIMIGHLRKIYEWEGPRLQIARAAAEAGVSTVIMQIAQYYGYVNEMLKQYAEFILFFACRGGNMDFAVNIIETFGISPSAGLQGLCSNGAHNLDMNAFHGLINLGASDITGHLIQLLTHNRFSHQERNYETIYNIFCIKSHTNSVCIAVSAVITYLREHSPIAYRVIFQLVNWWLRFEESRHGYISPYKCDNVLSALNLNYFHIQNVREGRWLRETAIRLLIAGASCSILDDRLVDQDLQRLMYHGVLITKKQWHYKLGPFLSVIYDEHLKIIRDATGLIDDIIEYEILQF